MTSINSATLLLATYKIVSVTGLDEPCYMIRFVNRTKDNVFISFDGDIDHEYLGHDKEIEIVSPFAPDFSDFRKLTKIYVRGTPSIGRIYVAAYCRNR
jgi:hypothetical protein